MSTAYIKQTVLPYRGEPTRRQRIDIEPSSLTFAKLYDQKMGNPDRKVGRQREEKPKALHHRPWSEEEVAKAQELRAKGLSYRLIGEALGRSKGNVLSKVKERGNT